MDLRPHHSSSSKGSTMFNSSTVLEVFAVCRHPLHQLHQRCHAKQVCQCSTLIARREKRVCRLLQVRSTIVLHIQARSSSTSSSTFQNVRVSPSISCSSSRVLSNQADKTSAKNRQVNMLSTAYFIQLSDYLKPFVLLLRT